MIEILHETEIDSSVEEVFQTLADVDAIPHWQASVIDVTPPASGSLTLGTVFEETAKAVGRKRHVDVRVAMYRPDELIAFSGDAGFMDFYCTYALESTPAGRTRLSSRSEFRLHGGWRLLEPLMRGEVRREVVSEVDALKQLVEAASGEQAAHPNS